MAKIEFEDKVALIVNPDIPDINKVTKNDMNEIKQVVNENDDKFLTNGLNVSNEVDEDYRVNLLYYGKSNIFTTTNATTGSNLTDTGSVNTNAPWGYTDYIEVYSGKKYNLKRSDNQTLGNTPAICFYDNSKTFISGIAYGSSRNLDLTIPSNAKYVRISYILEYASLYIFKCLESTSIVVDNEKYTDTLNVGSVVDSRSRINVLKSKNLYNVNTMPLTNGLWVSGTTIGSNAAGWYVVVPITGGKTYTISKKNAQNNKYVLFTCTTQTYPANGVSVVDAWGGSGTDTERAIQTSSSAKYLFIGLGINLSGDSEKASAIEELQVEEGSSANPYEPYIVPSIYVDNEEIYSKPVVLWTNPSPTSNFANQTITLSDSLDNYSFYEVSFYNSTSNTQSYSTGKIKSNVKTTLYYLSGLEQGGNAMIRYRDITGITNTTITFGTPYYKLLGQTSITEGSNQTVPYKIIGYK